MSDILEVDSLAKSYGGVKAIDQVSLRVEKGELHALIGPNGAGKTTLISLLSGMLKPDGGNIRFKGRNVTSTPTHKLVKLGLARSFQITSVFAQMSALENVRMAVQAHAGHSFRFWSVAANDIAMREQAMQFLHEVGLESRAEFVASTLSHGERRQLEIAMALALSPQLLLLDEPLAGMGPEESAAVIALLQQLKKSKTILMIEHDMDAVFSLADRITVLVYGAVMLTGTPAEIRANEDVNRAYLGDPESC